MRYFVFFLTLWPLDASKKFSFCAEAFFASCLLLSAYKGWAPLKCDSTPKCHPSTLFVVIAIPLVAASRWIQREVGNKTSRYRFLYRKSQSRDTACQFFRFLISVCGILSEFSDRSYHRTPFSFFSNTRKGSIFKANTKS